MKALFYDIETTPLKAYVWRTGKQVVNSGQLIEGSDSYDIICIGYCWVEDNKITERGVLGWGYKAQNSKKAVKQFTALCDEADIIIGKNNKRFDDKHMNSARLLHGLPGRPDLLSKVDDLETQMRRHFALPSYKLDYFSKVMGLGGKVNMKFSDWIEIVEKTPKLGEKAYNKMLKYCLKDVIDTARLWLKTCKHFAPKYNYSAANKELACTSCGSYNIVKNGTYMAGAVRYQKYLCKDHQGYAGKRAVTSKKQQLG